jgi:hypothetical protein
MIGVFMLHLRYSVFHRSRTPFIFPFVSYSTETVNDLAREILTVLQSGQMCVVVHVMEVFNENFGFVSQRFDNSPPRLAGAGR